MELLITNGLWNLVIGKLKMVSLKLELQGTLIYLWQWVTIFVMESTGTFLTSRFRLSSSDTVCFTKDPSKLQYFFKKHSLSKYQMIWALQNVNAFLSHFTNVSCLFTLGATIPGHIIGMKSLVLLLWPWELLVFLAFWVIWFTNIGLSKYIFTVKTFHFLASFTFAYFDCRLKECCCKRGGTDLDRSFESAQSQMQSQSQIQSQERTRDLQQRLLQQWWIS